MLVGLIGGSGVYDPEILSDVRKVQVPTPFGDVNVDIGRHGSLEVVFLQRHGTGHKIPPHRINYRANIWALWKIGVAKIISTSAVGSLNQSMPPGTIVMVDQFIDFTKGRETTFFDGGEFGLAHVDFSEPYCPGLRAIIQDAATAEGIECLNGGCYICVDGPRYETPAEIRAFRSLGADLVGMTNVPEVVLARELGLCYATICMVTNWAAGISQNKLSHEEVLSMMKANSVKLKSLLMRALADVQRFSGYECGCGGPANAVGSHLRGVL